MKFRVKTSVVSAREDRFVALYWLKVSFFALPERASHDALLKCFLLFGLGKQRARKLLATSYSFTKTHVLNGEL